MEWSDWPAFTVIAAGCACAIGERARSAITRKSIFDLFIRLQQVNNF
jgi:hypothetical protein